MRTFKEGDYVKFIGYVDYFSTYGTLITQDGKLTLNAVQKVGDKVIVFPYLGITFSSDGKKSDNPGEGVLLKPASKSDITRFIRQLTDGTINWGPGTLSE